MRIKPSQSNNQRQKAEALEKELRDKALIFHPDVQRLLKTANNTYSQAIYDSVITRLHLILESHATECMRTSDPFRPYGPQSLLSQGSLRLINQMDEQEFLIDPNNLVTGMLIAGPQGSGKSRFIIHLCCNELLRTTPNVKITIIDPKNGFGNLAQFRHIDLDNTSLDLTSPPNVSQRNFVYEFMPILADTCHLIYSLDFVNQAVDIAYSQLQHYAKQTGRETSLCIRDIYEALLSIKVTNFRQVGYHDAAKTALSLILGVQSIFSCRMGLSLEWIFSQNTVINARNLTNSYQCKVLVIFLLFWLYQRARNLPETTEIKHVLIIDDASRFVGTANEFNAQKRTSSLGHILSVLRSSGVCCVFASQLPAQIDPAVLSLSRNIIVTGNVNGEENLRILKSLMSLTEDEKNAIPRFKTREALAFISGSPWPYPVHGWTPFVADSPIQNSPSHDCSSMIAPWRALTDIPQKETSEQVPEQRTTIQSEKPAPNLTGSTDKLVWDCISYRFDKVRDRVKRLDFSIRIYESAKAAAMQDGLIIESSLGKSKHLIPTKKAYDGFNFPCPYERNASTEHSFYVQLAAHILKQDVTLSKVQVETPIGKKGSAVDVTTTAKNGTMTAYEITLSTGNLLSNAAKFQDTAYKRIIWLCRDAATAKAVRSYFNKSSALPSDLLSKFEYLHFSKFSSQIKKGKLPCQP